MLHVSEHVDKAVGTIFGATASECQTVNATKGNTEAAKIATLRHPLRNAMANPRPTATGAPNTRTNIASPDKAPERAALMDEFRCSTRFAKTQAARTRAANGISDINWME